MKPILEIKNISKKYKLRGQESPYLTFRDALTSGFKKKQSKDEFWALQDISFDVYPGESIGIIGRNGAGKSTLLKILSRITPPTKGEIIARGRIASLLEVGTGFHAELSGRENIFLNGSILGLTKQEIKSKFDEIVDFSGVEKFLDTPLKHYSSGMQLRLAFAVAAHLEPEILIIDEVLAVGDAEFQKKCLTKMGEVTSEGRTVLFVSHNMGAVKNLCPKSVLLNEGKIILEGKTNKVVESYLQSNSIIKDIKDRKDRKGSGEIIIESIQLQDLNQKIVDSVFLGQSFQIVFNYKVKRNIDNLDFFTFGFSLKTDMGVPLFLHHNRINSVEFRISEIASKSSFTIKIFDFPINKGLYSIDYSLLHNKIHFIDHLENAFILEVLDGKIYNNINNPPTSHGFYLINASWSLK
ncbi:MAG: ABC transporter ATP-binding protein [Chlorobi bacterium]|nr:ABC transporter ATP-binding protein [Chlorobiota bacterium]